MELTQSPERIVLANVPRINMYEGGPRCPEDVGFPSAMRAVLEYLGEDVGCDHCRPQGRKWNMHCSYAYFIGITGYGAMMTWAGPDLYTFSLDHLPGDPREPYRAAFEAVGYGVEFVDKAAGEALYRQKIIESIQKGRPVISFGIVGPPEAVLITGYDQGGDILTGWSMFQGEPVFNTGLEFEPAGPDGKAYFRKQGWFETAGDLIIVGEAGGMPDQGKVFEHSLARALEVMRTPEVSRNGYTVPTGTAAFNAWVEYLVRDENFQGVDDARMLTLYKAHDFSVGNLAEARWYEGLWMANTFSRGDIWKRSEDLLIAAACFTKQHELMWRAWDLCGGIGNPEGWRKFADPAVRKALVPVILDAREKDAQAAFAIERALSKR
jgi:hypothetical protein